MSMLAIALVFALTAQQWHQDLAFFARELPKRHLNAFHAVSREQFDAAVKELDARIGTARDEEIAVGFMRLTALVGDGHTNVHVPPEWHRLGVQLQSFGGEWRVTGALPATKALLGAKLTAIGGVPVADVVARLERLASQDELPPWQRVIVTGNMNTAEVLRGVGIDPTEITVVADDGTTTTAAIPTVTIADQLKQEWIWPSAQVPLARRDLGSSFVIVNLPAQNAVYVNWRRYDHLAENAESLWQLVDSIRAKRVIIDLRQNGGGDFKVGRRYMVSQLARRTGKVEGIVLIGARTFSAAMVNAIDFRKDAHALLVGNTIGEKPNSYSENDEMTLPNSKLVLSYSTRLYKFVPEDGPNVVEPDQRVEQTWADTKAGRDAALEWALAKK